MNDEQERDSHLPGPAAAAAPIAYVPPPVSSGPPPRTRSRFPAWGAAAAAVALVVGGAGGYVVAHDSGTSGFADTGGFTDRDDDEFAPSGDRPAPPRSHDDDGESSTGEGSEADT